MDFEQSFLSRTEGAIRRVTNWSDLPPAQVGLAAALRRAFEVPANENEQLFDDLIRQLG